MIDTMIEREIRLMALDCDLIVRTHLVIAHETGAMCTKALMPNGYETKRETETIGHPVNGNVLETLTGVITTTGDRHHQRINLNELVIGRSTSAHRERNITTIVNRKFLNGKSLATGSTGRRTRSETSETENVTDVTGIVRGSTTDSPPTLHLETVVRRRDIPVVSIDLLLCRIVTAVVVVVAPICHHLVRWITETIIAIISRNHLIQCRNRPSLEDTVMVSPSPNHSTT